MPGALTAIGDPAVRAAFRDWLLRIADDELIIGHRHSEWTGVGPDIESDVAMSSIAQEEIGHARAFYEQIAQDEGLDVDRLAFGRAPGEYRHAAFVELPNGGWEETIVRLTLYEPFETARLERLAASGQPPVADLAHLLVREERYHALFAETWLTRLARGAADGPGRVQAALDDRVARRARAVRGDRGRRHPPPRGRPGHRAGRAAGVLAGDGAAHARRLRAPRSGVRRRA